MGCFLACFGSSKDRQRRKRANNVCFDGPHPADRFTLKQSTPSLRKDNFEKPVSVIPDSRDKPQDQVSLCDRVYPGNKWSSRTSKKVTFDSNIRTYERISFDEAPEFLAEDEEEVEKGIRIADSTKPKQLPESEIGSTLSSLGSYPLNHRYQNYRESDDEYEQLGDEESDLEADHAENEDHNDEELYEDYDDKNHHRGDVGWELSPKSCMDNVENEDPMPDYRSWDQETDAFRFNHNARDRTSFVQSVLNPVENKAQWRAAKAKGTPPLLKQQKENSNTFEKPTISFSNDRSLKKSSMKMQSKLDELKNDQEIAVDASLSNWLVSSYKSPIKNTKTTTLDEAVVSKTSSAMLHGSNSLRTEEERPNLGALTAEVPKQLSLSSSPQRSPSRNHANMDIPGTVGAHWNDRTPVRDPGSASSFKGMPNTTSKYKEDKRVNWHSTPFETRLERALSRGAAVKSYCKKQDAL
ncbi:hypothetical protein Nepgr_022316 [Nepenthes gracilis]|uniref:Uncharacterized protein n=1 Tax=Nepenthes gracilis TaxID=150966 RepID=A0AAD3XY28_NEPGR|nr:hypothetical protein Nepgr_022316 [Nepenthes gracilis]